MLSAFLEQYSICSVSIYFENVGILFRTASISRVLHLIRLLFYAFVINKLEYATIVVQTLYYRVYNLMVDWIHRKFIEYLAFKVDGKYPRHYIQHGTESFISVNEHTFKFVCPLFFILLLNPKFKLVLKFWSQLF